MARPRFTYEELAYIITQLPPATDAFTHRLQAKLLKSTGPNIISPVAAPVTTTEPEEEPEQQNTFLAPSKKVREPTYAEKHVRGKKSAFP